MRVFEPRTRCTIFTLSVLNRLVWFLHRISHTSAINSHVADKMLILYLLTMRDPVLLDRDYANTCEEDRYNNDHRSVMYQEFGL
jgi:hypothetical protein